MNWFASDISNLVIRDNWNFHSLTWFLFAWPFSHFVHSLHSKIVNKRETYAKGKINIYATCNGIDFEPKIHRKWKFFSLSNDTNLFTDWKAIHGNTLTKRDLPVFPDKQTTVVEIIGTVFLLTYEWTGEASTDKGKLVYSTLSLNQTKHNRTGNKLVCQKSSLFFLFTFFFNFSSRQALRAHKNDSFTTRMNAKSNLFSTRSWSRWKTKYCSSALLLSVIYQSLKLSQQCRCYHIIVKDFW